MQSPLGRIAREDHAEPALRGWLSRYRGAFEHAGVDLSAIEEIAASEDGIAGNWKSRSSIGGVEQHPGQDYQCRCVSRAVIPAEFLGDD